MAHMSMEQVISNIQPVLDHIEDSISNLSLSSSVDMLLLVCPCYHHQPQPRCSHYTPSSMFPFQSIPRCMSPGEFAWMEMAQPFLDRFRVRVLWRCEDLSCCREFSCGFSSL